jgi:hypothetical protein
MRLPEFTAEASLGQTREGYIVTPGGSTETGGVQPQFIHQPIPHCGCHVLPGGGIVCTCI